MRVASHSDGIRIFVGVEQMSRIGLEILTLPCVAGLLIVAPAVRLVG